MKRRVNKIFLSDVTSRDASKWRGWRERPARLIPFFYSNSHSMFVISLFILLSGEKRLFYLLRLMSEFSRQLSRYISCEQTKSLLTFQRNVLTVSIRAWQTFGKRAFTRLLIYSYEPNIWFRSKLQTFECSHRSNCIQACEFNKHEFSYVW